MQHPSSARPGYVPPLAVLLVRTGRMVGQRLVLRTPVATLGRGSRDDLQLPDPSVGSGHARLELRQGVWMLTALGSGNATRVDGEVVSRDAPLSPGSTIVLGEVALLFEPRDRAEPRGVGGRAGGPVVGRRGRKRRSRWRVLRRILAILAILVGALLLLAVGAMELAR